jgi:hypothetical protein
MIRPACMLSNDEYHAYLCGILTKLVPILPCDELRDLASALGIKVSEFYGSTEKRAA